MHAAYPPFLCLHFREETWWAVTGSNRWHARQDEAYLCERSRCDGSNDFKPVNPIAEQLFPNPLSQLQLMIGIAQTRGNEDILMDHASSKKNWAENFAIYGLSMVIVGAFLIGGGFLFLLAWSKLLPESYYQAGTVSVVSANMYSCPSEECGILTSIHFGEKHFEYEYHGEWARVTRYRDAECNSGRSARIKSGNGICAKANGVTDGILGQRMAGWVKSAFVTYPEN